MDHIKFGTTEEVKKELKKLSDSLGRLCSYIRENLPRTGKNLVIHSIIGQSQAEIIRLSDLFPINPPNEILAWITRNLFELNLKLRYTLKNEESVDRFAYELAQDQIDIMEGVLELSEDPDDERVKRIRKQIGYHKTAMENSKIKAKLPYPTQVLAREVDALKEYRALYKLYSKYVHPSAFLLLGDRESVQSFGYLQIFIKQSQIYARDTASRASAAYGVDLEYG